MMKRLLVAMLLIAGLLSLDNGAESIRVEEKCDPIERHRFSYTATCDSDGALSGDGMAYGFGDLFYQLQWEFNKRAHNGEIKDGAKFDVAIEFLGVVRHHTVYAHGKAFYAIPRGPDKNSEIPRGNGRQ